VKIAILCLDWVLVILIRMKFGIVQHTMGPLHYAKFSPDWEEVSTGTPKFQNLVVITVICLIGVTLCINQGEMWHKEQRDTG